MPGNPVLTRQAAVPGADVASRADQPAGCLCQWDPYIPADPHSGNSRPMRRRLTEVQPICPVPGHGTQHAREACHRAIDAAAVRAADGCHGVALTEDHQGLTCPQCGRKWTLSSLFTRAENPMLLPSARVKAGGRPEVLTGDLEVIADGRIF